MKRLISLLLFLLAGCGAARTGTPATLPAATSSYAVTVAASPLPAAPVLPPTFTPPVRATLVTATPLPTPTRPAPTSTPVNFADTAVELRYRIPAIALDRRLQGTMGSQIIFADETVGRLLQRSNQGMILLELQQVLPALALQSVPEGCDTCVWLAYNLPVSGVSGEGWLQEPVLLASVENLLAVVLGPHFPPGTVIGLRRSASPYAPAQTIALTASGETWLWLATEGQIDAPQTGTETAVAPTPLLTTLQALELDSLANNYTTTCPGVPQETLYLNQGEQTITIAIACPEFTLPAPLLSLYLPLDAALKAKLAASVSDAPVRPPAAFPLAALLEYRRADGTRLTLYEDGQLVAMMRETAVFTTTLSASEIISLTAPLLESGLLKPGLASFLTPPESEPYSLLLLRGPQAVLDARWTGTKTAVAPLDELLEQLLPPAATREP